MLYFSPNIWYIYFTHVSGSVVTTAFCVFTKIILQEMKEQGEKRKRPKGDRDDDDTEQACGVRKKVKGGGMKTGRGAWRGGC